MMWYSAVALVLLFNPTFAFPKGKATEKPHSPNPATSKHRKPLTHISEFTDPDTGLNPFLDIEEGQTSLGRSAMEDEIIDDTPYFDIDLVEGDASNRRWGFSEPKDTFDTVPAIGRWPAVDYKDENFEFPVHPTTSTLVSSTTSKAIDAKETKMTETEGNKLNGSLKIEEKDHTESIFASKSAVIYVAASVVAIATVTLLLGACWWRRKLKNSHPASRVEGVDAKS